MAMKRGLVLEGGALRGLFSAGVIDVMMENGIDYDGVIGVSAGSNFGCNYKSRQPGRVIRYNVRFANDPRYMGLRSLITTGNLVGAEFAYHYMPLQLDVFDIATFESDPMEFYLVCTDCLTGEPVYYRMDKVDYDSLEWLRASASCEGGRPCAARWRHQRLHPAQALPRHGIRPKRGGAHSSSILSQRAH